MNILISKLLRKNEEPIHLELSEDDIKGIKFALNYVQNNNIPVYRLKHIERHVMEEFMTPKDEDVIDVSFMPIDIMGLMGLLHAFLSDTSLNLDMDAFTKELRQAHLHCTCVIGALFMSFTSNSILLNAASNIVKAKANIISM